MKMHITVCFMIVISLAGFFAESDENDFERFKLTHKKKYKNASEEKSRLEIFKENMKKIDMHNERFNKGEVTFQMQMNRFGDLSHPEFVKIFNGFKSSPSMSSNNVFRLPEKVSLPTEVDWRNNNMVTGVKNQGQCGSCWAFSATGSLEGQWFKKTGKLVSLSEQNLVDCSRSFGNMGCDGGWMNNAFNYIKTNGIESEIDYPYEVKNGNCRFDSTKSVANVTGFVNIPSKNEANLTQAIALIGPISIAIDAGQESFQFYRSGIYFEPSCSDSIHSLNHGVLVIGYGTEFRKDFFIVKNSWGEDWGMRGYIKMARNRKNNCGVATAASYPLV